MPVDRFISPENVMRHRFTSYPRPNWEAVVICFRDFKGSRLVVQRFDAQPVGYKVLYGLEEFEGVPLVFQSQVDGKRVGIVTRCNWGAPQAAILVEELAALGVRRIIGCGACGSLDPRLPRGTQAIAREGLCTDGTSRAYTDAATVPSSTPLLHAAHGVAKRLGIEVDEVCVATADALYRETPAHVMRWREAGADAVNMETSGASIKS